MWRLIVIELNHSEFNIAEPLFAGIQHSQAIVYAVLEGNSPGRIWVDKAQQPTCALLFPEGAFYYAAGDEHNETFLRGLPGLFFDELLPQAVEKELVLFSFSPAWHERLSEVLRHKGILTIQRKMFHFNHKKYQALNDWRSEIPTGLSMRLIDEQIAAQYSTYQSLLEPTSKRFGFCLMEGEVVACACTSVFVGHGEAEIDIYTEERYRGHGFARLTACAFIDECLRRGLIPNWACWPEREASWKLALRLGFEELPDVPALLWAEDL